jgi:hypothetical protein
LLVVRDAEPGKGLIWPLGGGVRKGIPTEDSLSQLVKRECGLEISNIHLLGGARVLMSESPFGNDKGVDDYGLNFYAKATGRLQLDSLHKAPQIITHEDYWKNGFRDSLHPYVQRYLDLAWDHFFQLRGKSNN